jgi:NAD(P)-dependent dehydrogenase (short-subunit alcohol dehydrogenase family)
MPPQVILITGASSGIGRACAERLGAQGHRVYGTSRKPAGGASPVTMLEMDVTREADVDRAVSAVLQAESRLDVLVNNAGSGVAGAVEDTTLDEARAQFETNFFGPLRVCSAVLPHMRAQRSGLIVNVSSIAGSVPLPFQGIYSATKAALGAMTEALRMEVRPFGVRVVLLEPGDFRTGFTASRTRARASDSPAYAGHLSSALQAIERDELDAPSPQAIARRLEQLVHDPAPRLRHRIGTCIERSAPLLRAILPDSLFERLLARHYGMDR